MTLKSTNFTGHLLVAMPMLNDPSFVKSVIYICSHSEDGAMGLVINRPTTMTYAELFAKVHLTLLDRHIETTPVLFGGPVQPERGFILHPYHVESQSQDWDSSIVIQNGTALTTSKDILEAVANNAGPKKMLLSLGYAGWTPGQLEDEISQNAWLSVCPTSQEELHTILFDTPFELQLDAALAQLGVSYSMLSDVAGHA
jgi:putative transcriptional regulator